jgi:hypothetical protein
MVVGFGMRCKNERVVVAIVVVYCMAMVGCENWNVKFLGRPRCKFGRAIGLQVTGRRLAGLYATDGGIGCEKEVHELEVYSMGMIGCA